MTKRTLGFFVLATVLFSCSDETTVFEQPEDTLFTETNLQVLEQSLSFDKSGVLELYTPEAETINFSRIPEEQAGDFPLTLIAQVAPPKLTGRPELTASHVAIEGDFAYVSYNGLGDYFGAIDVINIAKPEHIKLVARLFFSNADINSLAYYDGFLYAVGGVDSEKSTLATANSLLAKLPVENGRFNLRAGLLFAFQEGNVATDVVVENNRIFVVSGMDGYLNTYETSELGLLQSVPSPDLRSIAIDGGQVALLDGVEGVQLLDALELTEAQKFPLDAVFEEAHKRTIDISENHIYVSQGASGAGVYDRSTGRLQQLISIPLNPAGVADTDIVTNATSFNKGVMLMANGGAGLCLSVVENQTELVGIIGLEGSINFVESKGDYIFAASGKEGLQVIKMNRATPDDLQAKCIDAIPYQGKASMNISENTSASFSGNKRLASVTVDGTALLCGFWTVSEDVSIGEGAELGIYGSLFVGSNKNQKKVIVKSGATLRIEGTLAIYGDLVLEENAQLIFGEGTNNIANIFGSVELHETAEVIGSFEDVQGSLK